MESLIKKNNQVSETTKMEIQYQNGQIEGIITTYYENGQIESKELFEQGIRKWISVWGRDGRLIYSDFYDIENDYTSDTHFTRHL